MANKFRSPFKWRKFPISQGYGFNKPRNRWHYAVDIAARQGTVIWASASGVVLDKGYNPDDATGLGHWILIKHSDGVTTLYAHMQFASKLRIGQKVRWWQPIGRVGQTGAASGPHLHFRVEVAGVPVNPLTYLATH